MMRTDFFIIVRYGIGITNENWYEYRSDLLKTILLPSLIGQTDQNFSVIFCIDKNIPEKWENELFLSTRNLPKSYFQKYDFHGQIHGNHLSGFIRDLKKPESTTIVSRIDDDDAIISTVVEKIRSKVVLRAEEDPKATRTILALEQGYAAYPEEAILVPQIARFGSSVMMTSVSSGEAVFTPFSFAHHKFREFAEENSIYYDYILKGTPSFHYTQHRNADHISRTDYEKGLMSEAKILATDDFLSKFNINHSRYKSLHFHLSRYRSSTYFTGEGGKQIDETNALRRQIFHLQQRMEASLSEEDRQAISSEIESTQGKLHEVQKHVLRIKN